jgi:hypothetical protein
MQAISWVRSPRHFPGARRAVNATVLEVAREIGRAVAALAGLVAWGALLLLLVA